MVPGYVSKSTISTRAEIKGIKRIIFKKGSTNYSNLQYSARGYWGEFHRETARRRREVGGEGRRCDVNAPQGKRSGVSWERLHVHQTDLDAMVY